MMVAAEVQPPGAAITIEELAGGAFTPWSDRSISVPTPEDWELTRRNLRIALEVMFKDKAELIDAVKSLGGESVAGSLQELDTAKDTLQRLATLIDAATSRLMVAMAAAVVDEEATDAVDTVESGGK